MAGEPYGAPGRNQFYPPSSNYYGQSKYMPPNPKYSKNYSKYYQHSGGLPPPLPPHLAGGSGAAGDEDPALAAAYPYGGPPPPHLARFNPNYHYMNKFDPYHQYHANNPHFNGNPLYSKPYGGKTDVKSGDKSKGSDASDTEAKSDSEVPTGGASPEIEIDRCVLGK